jgi:hypothetical protein
LGSVPHLKKGIAGMEPSRGTPDQVKEKSASARAFTLTTPLNITFDRKVRSN